jgi:hypothetical protein
LDFALKRTGSIYKPIIKEKAWQNARLFHQVAGKRPNSLVTCQLSARRPCAEGKWYIDSIAVAYNQEIHGFANGRVLYKIADQVFNSLYVVVINVGNNVASAGEVIAATQASFSRRATSNHAANEDAMDRAVQT